jgi:diguanylate cyclase (GGDEF)-like protein
MKNKNDETDQKIINSTELDIADRIETKYELLRRKNFDRLITQLSTNLINAPLDDIDKHINHILAEIGQLIRVDRCYFFTLNNENNTISNTHEWCKEGIEPEIDNLQNIPCETLPWWMSKLKLLGFIGVDSVVCLRTWTEDEATILRLFGGIIGSAILQKKNQQELAQRKRNLEKLYAITKVFLNTSNVKELMNNVTEKLGEIINANYCSIVLCDEKQDGIYVASSSGTFASKHREITLKKDSLSMSTSVLKAGHSLIAEDAENSPYVNKELVKQTKTKSLLGVPMTSNQSKLGVVVFGFLKPHQFNDEEVNLAEQATLQIALAIEKIRLFEQTQKNEQAATRLHKAGAIVASTLEPEIAIERILDQLESVVPFDSASIQIMEEGYLEIRSGRGWPSSFNPVGYKFPIPGNNPNTIVVQTKKPFVLNDAPEEYAAFRNPNHANIRSWLGVPLIAHDRVIGILTLDHYETKYYNDDHLIEIVMAFADQVTISLENARLYAEEHRRVMELDALRETTADITRELELRKLLCAILERATALMNATGGELGLIDDDGKHIHILVSYNMGSDNVGDDIEVGQGLMGYVVQTKQTEIVENYKNWDRRLETYRENKIYAAIGAPLMIGNRILGVIGVMNSDRKRKFSSAEKDLMHSFAQQAAIAVENAKLFEEKERQARVDVTTDIYNRRGLLELGKRELDRAHRYERPLAAMMVDIDHFKLVNDTYGHPIGDLVLKELARILDDNIRTIDILGRYGGEEFVILLPETTPDSAYEIAERLRKTVAEHNFTPEHLDLNITISIGVAFSTGESNGLIDLIKRADNAMYESKDAGRNRTSVLKSPDN